MSSSKDILKYIDSNGVIRTPITNIESSGGITVNQLTDSTGQYELGEVQIGCPITEMYVDGNVSIGGQGTVTSVAVEGNQGIAVTGSPITNNGTIKLDLQNHLQDLTENINHGILVQTEDTGGYQARSLETIDNSLIITNPDGVIGNPTISLNTRLRNFSFHWPQGFLVQRTSTGDFSSRRLVAGSGVTITNPDGINGDPVISVSSGGGGNNYIGFNGAIDGEGYTGQIIYTYLANQNNFKYNRWYFEWQAGVGASNLSNNSGIIHTLPDLGGNVYYSEEIQTGLLTGFYRKWKHNYSLGDYDGLGSYGITYSYVKNAQLVEADALKIQMLDYYGTPKALASLFGDLDMHDNTINNVGYPSLGHQAANKDYVDSQVGLNLPGDAKLFLNGFGQWTTPYEYPGFGNLYLDGLGNWSPPIVYPGDPNLYLNGAGGWVTFNGSWLQDTILDFGDLRIHWIDDGSSHSITQVLPEALGSNPQFIETIRAGDRYWYWDYGLGYNGTSDSCRMNLIFYGQDVGYKSVMSFYNDGTEFTATFGVRTVFTDRVAILGSPISPQDAVNLQYLENKTWQAQDISDFHQKVRENNLNQLARPETALDMNQQRLINGAEPIGPTDFVTKNYVDNRTASSSSCIIGEYKLLSSSTAPLGFLLCDGTAVDRTIYNQLFLVIGVAFGSGNGSTTFNLPDLRGKVAGGVSATTPLGNNAGANIINLSVNQLPPHNHTGSISNTAAYSGSGATNYMKTGSRPDNANWYKGVSGTYTSPMGYHEGNGESFSAINVNNGHSHTLTLNNTGLGQAIDIRQPTLYTGYWFIYSGV